MADSTWNALPCRVPILPLWLPSISNRASPDVLLRPTPMDQGHWLDSQDHRTYSGRSYRFQEQAYNAFDSRSITAEWVDAPSRGPANPAATRLAGRFSGEAGLFRRCWLLHRPTVKKISLGVDGCDPGFKMSQAPKREKNLTSAGGLASR